MIEGQRIVMARVAVGGVAPVPLRLPLVEEALVGAVPDPESLESAARLASQGTKPAPQAGFKVRILEGTVLEALEQAVSGDASSQAAMHERG